MTEVEKELIELTQHLLDSIASGDWEAYQRLCDPTLTAFEPEARGHLVSGMAFHQFYFDLAEERSTPVHTTMSAPHVRMLGNQAAMLYVILYFQPNILKNQQVNQLQYNYCACCIMNMCQMNFSKKT